MIKSFVAIFVALWPVDICAFSPPPPSTGSVSSSSTSTSSTRLQALEAFNFKNPFESNNPFFASNGGDNSGKVAVIAGATGYIGKSTVRESVRQGYKTVALVRDKKKVLSDEGNLLYGTFFEGADVVECDVCDAEKLTETLKEISAQGNGNIEAIVSCLASRSGIKKDAYAIDYQATLNCLESGRAVNARHFVLLSAFCVKNPWLQFQQAKLKFEAALTEQQDMSYTIVRPTAFFKSVSGQLEVIQQGAPFVMFGDGEVTRCNPISEADLATYLIDSIKNKSRLNKIINLGGPDEPLTMKKQGEMLYKAVGKEPNFFYAPLWLFDVIIDSLQWVADTFKSEKFENAAELGRIGKYYAVEDMLTTDPEEKFGTMTLQEHYDKIAVEGQEYDPYTSMFAKSPAEKTAEKKEKVAV